MDFFLSNNFSISVLVIFYSSDVYIFQLKNKHETNHDVITKVFFMTLIKHELFQVTHRVNLSVMNAYSTAKR
jgi:hypothetical protein